MKTSRNVFLILVFISIFSCEKEETNTLEVRPSNINFGAEGGSEMLTVLTDADSWEIYNPAPEWISLSRYGGKEKAANVTITVDSKSLELRDTTLVVKAGNAKPVNITISQKASDYLYNISVSSSSLTFTRAGNKTSISITTDAPGWILSNNADWLDFSTNTGVTGATTINITAEENPGSNHRYDTITFSAEYAPDAIIYVKQNGEIYPSYNTNPIEPDMTGMTSSAVSIASKMKIGWNIGNTLEAIGGETAWGNPLVTDALIKLVKQNGFNAIRIPCSWNQYLASSSTAQLKADWLDRVKEVVQYCVNNDMYVILNIHWDGGWLENNCTVAKQEENNAKQKAFWEQIATHLRDFDEHLLFASANEPNVENATQMSVLMSYHQTFVDAVRSTGGKNSYRVLVVQGPSTDIEKTNTLMTTMPTDEIAGRMMAEIHYYTPYQFCLMTEDANWGKMFYYWGSGYHSTTDTERNATWGEESTMVSLFGQMKSKFVMRGIPVIMGEFAVIRRTAPTGDNLDLHLASRAYFLKYLTKQAKANGIIPFYWDAGNMGTNASALFNRQSYTVYDQQALDALMEGINE
ncbi:MAG: cellulase family glycosylhydrolase [Bacteroidales bacterium]|nr:cellulase family glycosylhydrolase [Bacteroidales bacterium]